MTPDLAELKRIAEAASPGPWRGDRIDGSVKYDLLDADGDPVIRGDNGNVADTGCYGIQSDEDEAYLLAFDPPTCLALIARIEALEAGLKEVTEEFGGSIERYHKIGPDFTHKDGTETLWASTLLDREELIRRCANLLGDRHD